MCVSSPSNDYCIVHEVVAVESSGSDNNGLGILCPAEFNALIAVCPDFNCNLDDPRFSTVLGAFYCCYLCQLPAADQSQLADDLQVGPYPSVNCALNTFSMHPPDCSTTTPVPLTSVLSGCSNYIMTHPMTPTTVTITLVYNGLSCSYLADNQATVNAAVIADVYPTAVVTSSTCTPSGTTTTTTFIITVTMPSQNAANAFANSYTPGGGSALANLPAGAEATAGVGITSNAAASKVSVQSTPPPKKSGSSAVIPGIAIVMTVVASII